MADITYSFSKILSEFGTAYITTAASDTITAPLERIKLILQTQDVNPDIKDKYSGVIDASARMIGKEGSTAYWKGNMAQSIKNLASIGLKIFFIHQFRDGNSLQYLSDKIETRPGLLNEIISSAFAESMALAITYPFEYAYIMKGSDIDPNRVNQGAFSTIYDTVKKHGILALYSGLGLSVFSIFLHRIFSYKLRKFGEFIFAKSTWHDAILSQIILAFATSSILSLLRHPLETIKRKLIVQNKNEKPPYRGAIDCIIQTFYNEGLPGFFSGISVPILKIGFSATIVIGLDFLLKKEVSSLRRFIENIIYVF